MPDDPAIVGMQQPMIVYGVNPNPFEFNNPGSVWFYKDPKMNI